MKKPIDRSVAQDRLLACIHVDVHLATCVRMLDEHGARNAAAYVRRARKSVQGAIRHASRLAENVRREG